MAPSHLPTAAASLGDKLAQLMMIRIGSNLPPARTVEQDQTRVAETLESCPLGGLIVFNGHADLTPGTLANLQRASRYPLLVGADIERGVGQQLHGLPLYPHAMAFDALGDEAPAVVAEFAEQTARSARAHGLHINFGPVADVHSDPRNPIIATRAFSSSPARAAELVHAFVVGCRQGGVLSTAKHFPGHGNTHQDSHHELPRVEASRAELVAINLPPFAAAVAAGVDLIMTAHVGFPAFDASGLPATLSRPILVELLRQELGFRGAVVSDSLLMAGVQQGFATEGAMAVAALEAGVDLLLDIADPIAAVAELAQAVETGVLSRERVDQAFDRVLRLKTFVQASSPSRPDEAPGAARHDDDALSARVAGRACQVLHCDEALLPLRADLPLTCVLLRPYQSPLDPSEQPLAEALRARFTQVDYVEVTPDIEPSQLAALADRAAAAPQLCVALIVKPAAWHRFGLPPAWQTWLHALLGRRSFPLACLGSPEGLGPYGEARLRICTFSDVPSSQQALAALLAADRP